MCTFAVKKTMHQTYMWKFSLCMAHYYRQQVVVLLHLEWGIAFQPEPILATHSPQPNVSGAVTWQVWRAGQCSLGLKRRREVENEVAKITLLQPESMTLWPLSISPPRSLCFGIGFHQYWASSLPTHSGKWRARAFDSHPVVPHDIGLEGGIIFRPPWMGFMIFQKR